MDILISFQNPLEVPGINLADFTRNTIEQRIGKRTYLWDFRKEIVEALEVLNMDSSYADHGLSAGFSGGEKERVEILRLLTLKPSLVVLDEADFDLDMDAIRTVSRGVEEYQKDKNSALIIIIHNIGILSSLKVDKARVLVKRLIVADDDGSLVEEVNRDGLAELENKEWICRRKEKRRGPTWKI